MARSQRLRLKDVHDLHSLIGECRELASQSRPWRPHMLQRLRERIGAKVALGMILLDPCTTCEHLTSPLDDGFLRPEHRSLWGRYQQEQAFRDDPFHLGFFGDFRGRLRTRNLGAVVEPNQWCRSRHCNEYVRACGLGDRITTACRLNSGGDRDTLRVVVLHRSESDGPFDRRAQRFVHVLHYEMAPLLGEALPLTNDAEATRPLPPRLQQVLAALLLGDSEKQIALRLGISRHTVNRHVQRLYRQMNVQSRGELTYRCRDLLPALSPPQPLKAEADHPRPEPNPPA